MAAAAAAAAADAADALDACVDANAELRKPKADEAPGSALPLPPPPSTVGAAMDVATTLSAEVSAPPLSATPPPPPPVDTDAASSDDVDDEEGCDERGATPRADTASRVSACFGMVDALRALTPLLPCDAAAGPPTPPPCDIREAATQARWTTGAAVCHSP